MNFICHSDLSQICDERLEMKRLRKEEENRKVKERGLLIYERSGKEEIDKEKHQFLGEKIFLSDGK